MSEGSFFEEVSAGADAYVLKSILQGWSNGDYCKILQNVKAAM